MRRAVPMLALVAAALTTGGAAPISRGPTFDLSWRTIDGGGGTSTGAGFELSGTIGQADAGVVTGGGFTLEGGFWSAPFVPPCPADLDGSGAVDFADILAILAAWGNAGGPEDLDDSGTVDFGDILVVLAAWGPCP